MTRPGQPPAVQPAAKAMAAGFLFALPTAWQQLPRLAKPPGPGSITGKPRGSRARHDRGLTHCIITFMQTPATLTAASTGGASMIQLKNT